MSEDEMKKLHRRHNEEYKKYKTTNQLLQELDLFSKGFRFKDLEEINKRLNILDAFPLTREEVITIYRIVKHNHPNGDELSGKIAWMHNITSLKETKQ